MNFSGKTAIVTGGSRGIGRAVCLELARGGANVVLCYAGNEEAARTTASECEALGASVLTVKCDVSDSAQVKTLVDSAITAYGRVDILRTPHFLDALTVYRDRRDYPHKLNDAITAYGLEDQAVNSHRAVDDARAAAVLLEAMAAERDDLDRYVDLFGYSPKYGVSGRRIASVEYRPQPYQRVRPLYEVTETL